MLCRGGRGGKCNILMNRAVLLSSMLKRKETILMLHGAS